MIFWDFLMNAQVRFPMLRLEVLPNLRNHTNCNARALVNEICGHWNMCMSSVSIVFGAWWCALATIKFEKKIGIANRCYNKVVVKWSTHFTVITNMQRSLEALIVIKSMAPCEALLHRITCQYCLEKWLGAWSESTLSQKKYLLCVFYNITCVVKCFYS